MVFEQLINFILIEFGWDGKTIKEFIGLVIYFEEFDRIGKIFDGFGMSPFFIGLLLSLSFGLGTIEKTIDILFSHDVFLVSFC